MKDIKTLMIGFLLATCMFMIIGFTDKEINEKKKFTCPYKYQKKF